MACNMCSAEITCLCRLAQDVQGDLLSVIWVPLSSVSRYVKARIGMRIGSQTDKCMRHFGNCAVDMLHCLACVHRTKGSVVRRAWANT